MLGFVLARLSYLNISGGAPTSYASGSAPGEWYWNSTGLHRVGITLHLGAILPGGFLLIWQFVPMIRYKLLTFHRINGYIVILLVCIANVGALLIARRAFGGSLETQAGIGTLVILTTTSICMAYYNIRRLQIDQHRAWMLRTAFYLGTVITLRLIMILSALIISVVNSYDTIMTCNDIASIYRPINGNDNFSKSLYPECSNATATNDSLAIVHATFANGRPEQIGASLRLSFGMAMWMAIILHLVGVEIYLALTPRESNRLRQVSYERQLERGFPNPGSAGLTVERWGDADEWQPVKC